LANADFTLCERSMAILTQANEPVVDAAAFGDRDGERGLRRRFTGRAMSKYGHLERISAFEFSHYLCVTGDGMNPAIGWTNWLAPIDALPNTYEFLQEPPAGPVLPVVMPFQAMGVFTSNGVREVLVRHLVNGRPADARVQVHPITRIENENLLAFMSASTLSHLCNKGNDRTLPLAGSSFRMRLGSVDVPFDCGTWNSPERARRHEVHLEVESLLPGMVDIERAVLACFERGPAAAALATLLAPAGWAAGTGDVQRALETDLLARLGDKLVGVRVTSSSFCLRSELAGFQERRRASASGA
jgi:hypothetical protein